MMLGHSYWEKLPDKQNEIIYSLVDIFIIICHMLGYQK